MTLGEEVLPSQEVFDELEISTMISSALRDFEHEVELFTEPAERLLAKGKMKGYEALLIVANDVEHSKEKPPPKPYLTDKQMERLRLLAGHKFQLCREARSDDLIDEENLDFQMRLIEAKRVKHRIFLGMAWHSLDSIKASSDGKLSGRKLGLYVAQANVMLRQFIDEMFDEQSLEVNAKKHFHYPFISELAHIHGDQRDLKPGRSVVPKKTLGDYPHKPWMTDAACLDIDNAVDVMFPTDGRGSIVAKKVCESCVVREECADYALEHRVQHGVWGGMSERTRNTISKERTAEEKEG